MSEYPAEFRFNCPNCQHKVVGQIWVPTPNWVGPREGNRVLAVEQSVECDGCHKNFVIHVDSENRDSFGSLKGFESVVAVAIDDSEPVFDDIWVDDYDYDPPENPSLNLINTLGEVNEVLNATEMASFASTVSRMAFIQQFAALEAYLSDTLISQITSGQEALGNAITKIEDLKAVRVSLKEIIDDPEIVRRKCVAILRSFVYHNFNKIDQVYQATLGFTIFPDSHVKSRMFKAIPLRHDCVHRNGKDIEGQLLIRLDDGFLEQMDRDILSMLHHIEEEIDNNVWAL